MKIYGIQQITNEEKDDILSLHRELYNGYQTMQPKVPNQQPLYVQDFAKDKVGAVMSNKGNVKGYTNVGINEQIESKEVCDECGAMMMEGECSECGWKGEVGAMEEDECMECGSKYETKEGKGDHESTMDQMLDLFGSEKKKKTSSAHKDTMKSLDQLFDLEDLESSETEGSWDRFKNMFRRKKENKEGYNTGKLSDIYDIQDLGDSDFDYVEGGGNKYGTFEKMHHMKKIKNESKYQDPDNEDDGFEDMQLGEDEMHEQGFTGGGNTPKEDPRVKDAYDFKSDGPGDVYPTEGEIDEDHMDLYEPMESSWEDKELDEYDDISGVQGIYGDMEPAYDFDSEGPGKAGPYQRFSYQESADNDEMTDDLEEELQDLDESFFQQKKKIQEMFQRMKNYN